METDDLRVLTLFMEGSKMKKGVLTIILMAAMSLFLLPTTVLAEDASMLICYGTNGQLTVTLPTTDNYYTYGTTNADGTLASQTAANASALPDSGWTWAVQKVDTSVDGTTYGYTMTLNGFNSNTSTWTGDNHEGNCIRFSNLDLRVVAKGTNTLVTRATNGTAIITETSANKLLISGNGVLNATGNIGLHAKGGLTVNSGTINAAGTLWGLGSNGPVKISGGDVTTTGGTSGNSYGIKSFSPSIIISGGNVTAKVNSTSNGASAFNVAPILPADGYLWRTAASDGYTPSSTTKYAYTGNQAYVKITPINYCMDFDNPNPVSWYSGFPSTNFTTTDSSGSGWSWDASEKQLTLSGLNFTTRHNIAIRLPDGARVVLAEGTANTVKSGMSLSEYDGMGIYCPGSLAISGKGTLNVTGSDRTASTGASYGISCTDITISDGTINAVGGPSAKKSFGINSTNATTITNGTVTAKSTSATGTKGAFNLAPTLTGYKGDYQWNTNENSPVWTQSADTTFTNADSPAYVKIKSALTFTDSKDYDIPAGMVGTAITPVDVSGGVSSGTSPYTFSLENAPSWLSITEAGVISGTRPAKATDAATVTVKVTDSGDPAVSRSITIDIGAVAAAPIDPSKPVDPSNPVRPSIPATGDSSMPGFWIVLAIMSAAGLTANAVTARKKRRA